MSSSARKSETLEPTGSKALSALLSSPTLSATSTTGSAVRRAGPLIAEVGECAAHTPTETHAHTHTHTHTHTDNAESEGPTLLEQMMAEQRQAMHAKREKETKKLQKEAQKSFGGFKKGFFGNSSAAATPSKPSTASNNNNNNTNSNKDTTTSINNAINVTTSTATSSSSSAGKKESDIVEVKARESERQRERDKGVVLEEVQTAMKEDNPLLSQLRSNEWVTPDLTAALQSNPVLSRGFSDPKCLAAVELMQRDPQAAKERFQKDPQVSLFLHEFGKVMSAHFERLSLSQQQQQQQKAKESETHKPIEEIGPLQAQALQKQREQEKAKEPQKKMTKSKESDEDAEQARVQQILNDPELRELLMDADLQRILVECGDPTMLREHMRNASTVRKIQKLQRAGLVQMQI